MKLSEIRNKFRPDGVTTYQPAFGRTGAITDDTQMTLWTAEGLGGGFGSVAVVKGKIYTTGNLEEG